MMKTSVGDIAIELYPDKAPETVANFLWYVDNKFYDGLIFHRVMSNFMIQGGGFNKDMLRKETKPSIKNEADNGLSNMRGTIAMARTGDPHSASSQFFINVKDNKPLDFKSKANPAGWGYCVFGKVISGMDVVDKIRQVPVDHERRLRERARRAGRHPESAHKATAEEITGPQGEEVSLDFERRSGRLFCKALQKNRRELSPGGSSLPDFANETALPQPCRLNRTHSFFPIKPRNSSSSITRTPESFRLLELRSGLLSRDDARRLARHGAGGLPAASPHLRFGLVPRHS